MRKDYVALMGVVLVAAACGSDGPPTGGPDTGTITGQVIDVDSSNGGVSGASVQLSSGGANQTVTTGATGSFSLSNADPGSWQGELQVPGTYELAQGEAGTRTASVTAGQTATLTPFELARPKGDLAGTVEEDGTDIAGGTVTASRGGFPDRTATPDASGYTIADLPVGDWSLVLEPPATHVFATGENGTRDVTIAEGETETVSAFELAPAPPQPTVVEITLSGTSFSDTNVTIDVGTTVRWIVVSGQPHTVTSENSVWTEQNMTAQDQEFEFTFTTAGTYRYRCVPHSTSFTSGMVGVITVN